MVEHVVFFDGQCPFCHRSVRHLIEIDEEKKFKFAPLNGKTAQEILTGPQESLRNVDSLILVENYHSTEREFFIRSRAIFRIYWHIGHGWGLIGILSFLPNRCSDWFYRWFAVHRHQFKLKMPDDPGPSDRFLP